MFKKILVAFDGSEPSKHALDYAADMAFLCKGTLIILTVVPRVNLPLYPDESSGTPIVFGQDLTKYQDRLKVLYKNSLTEAIKDVKENFPDLKIVDLFLEGRPSAIIIEEAERNGVDLIVLGSRGIGGISGWILGSTSRRVVDSCTKPVLVVK
ncbi:universal stress protein [Candidatus Bathyarchaeota archaeon]|nr:universal stress protein [Candidatus Bathyarchaeota archaeon]